MNSLRSNFFLSNAYLNLCNLCSVQLCSCLSEFVTVAFLLTFTLSCLNSNLLVILLQRCQVFARLRKFSLFHTFANIPVHKCTLAVHQVEFVVDAREDLGDGRRVADPH